MKLIPGSHTMEFERGRLDANLFLRQDLLENKALLQTVVDVELEAGDVLFFHCRTFHAAGANKTDRAKYSLVFSYHAADNFPIPDTRSARLDSVNVEQ
jgi:phytanoyl-CoA hydroxylase